MTQNKNNDILEQNIIIFMNSDFGSFSIEEKKNICLTILSKTRSQWDIFAELYELVSSNNATERDYQNIYDAAMVVLDSHNKEQMEVSIHQLEKVKISLEMMKKQEKEEHQNEIYTASSLVNNIS